MPHFICGKLRLIATIACFSVSPAVADQVVLKNGDRVTGTIVKKDAKDLTIKTDHFGVITTAWEQVASITADKPVNVVLSDGRTLRGTMTTAGGKVEVVADNTRASVAPGDITILRDADEQKAYERLLQPGWGDLWAGSASLGFAGTIGNARTSTFTTSINAVRATKTDKTSIYFKTISASALANGVSAATARAVRAGVAYDHNLSSRMFVNIFNDWEYDRFQNLDLRFVVGGGVGFHAVKTERSRLDLLAGFDYNHSKFNTPLTRNTGELFWGDDYNYKLSSITSFVQTFRMFNTLSDPGAYRVNADIGLSTKLWKRLSWDVSLSDRYLRHPAPGRKTNDLIYTTGLGITFAR